MSVLPYQLTKTLLCSVNELQGVSAVDPLYPLNTTINFKRNIEANTTPANLPTISYFGIGINGFKNLNDQNLSAPYRPSSYNMDLYEPLPFRVVPASEDLTPVEQSQYRIRVLQEVNGEFYWCYYLKKLTILGNRIKIVETNLTTGDETELQVLDPDNLNPVPTITSAEGVVDATTSIGVHILANLNITGAEVVEAINVLHNGNLLKAKISEIGIYTGNDEVVNGDSGTGGSISYTEAIFTQLAYHYTNNGSDFSDIGRIEDISLRISGSTAYLA